MMALNVIPGFLRVFLCVSASKSVVTMGMNLLTFWWLMRRSLISTFNDGCIGSAKGAAYSAMLSFFPMLTSAAAIMVQTRTEFVAATLEGFLSQIVPPGTED